MNYKGQFAEAYEGICWKIENYGGEYLSKEQLEEEGWKLKEGSLCVFIKDGYGLNFFSGIEKKEVNISTNEEELFANKWERSKSPKIRLYLLSKTPGCFVVEYYSGNCKNIEDFKKLCKIYL